MDNLKTVSLSTIKADLTNAFMKHSFDDLLVDSDKWRASPWVAFDKSYIWSPTSAKFDLGHRSVQGFKTLEPVIKDIVENLDKFSIATVQDDVVIEESNTKYELTKRSTEYKGYIVTKNQKDEMVIFDMLKFMPLVVNLKSYNKLTLMTRKDKGQAIFVDDNNLVAVIMGLQVWDDMANYIEKKFAGVQSII